MITIVNTNFKYGLNQICDTSGPETVAGRKFRDALQQMLCSTKFYKSIVRSWVYHMYQIGMISCKMLF